MPIRLRRENFVSAVPLADGRSLVLEAHGGDHVHLFAVDERGEPRAFVRFDRGSIPGLIEALSWLVPRGEDDE